MSYGKTDPGVRRPNNEDDFGAFDDLGLYLVADGLGGHPDGEVASRLAVETAKAAVEEAASRPSTPLPSDLAREAVQRANVAILERDVRDDQGRGMATTLSALLLRRDEIGVAHVGDCRVYRWRRGEPLRRLTRDHSRAQTLVDQGLLTEEQAAHDPWAHQLERALGLESSPEVDALVEARQPGDRFLLCSDGLIRVVGEDEIASTLGGTLEPREQVEHLIALARERGAPDNVTVIVVRDDGGE